MIQAAPLVLSFARAVPMLNKLVGAVGITELGNRVNNYIQENPDESAKIVSMIMPTQGIANALKNKSSEDVEEVEETEEVTTGSGVEEKIREILREAGVEDADNQDLTDLPKDLEAKVMSGIAKSSPNKKEDMKEASAIIGLSGPARETKKMADEIDDRYEGGLEEVTKTKGYDFRDYIPKGAYKKRYADGGAIGIEVLFEEKKPRKNFNTGGTPYDARATTQDYTNALQKVSAGTTYQQQEQAKQYARNEAANELRAAIQGGDVALDNFLQSAGPGVHAKYRSVFPDTRPGRNKQGAFVDTYKSMNKMLLNDLVGAKLKYTTYAPKPKPKTYRTVSPEAQALNMSQSTYQDIISSGKDPKQYYMDYQNRIMAGNPNLLKYGQVIGGPGMGIAGPGTAPGATPPTQAQMNQMMQNNPMGYMDFADLVKTYSADPYKGLQEEIKDVVGGRDTGYMSGQDYYDINVLGLDGRGIAEKYGLQYADGGRVGLFMGGDPLTGQALQTYNSMKAYGFSDQEIADALSLQRASASSVEPAAATAPAPINIINQNRGGDGPDDDDDDDGPTSNADLKGFDAVRSAGLFALNPVGFLAAKAVKGLYDNYKNPYTNIMGGLNQATKDAIDAENKDFDGRYGGLGPGPGPGNTGAHDGPSGVGGGYNEGNACFDPSTLIQMADGSTKEIKNIQLGDDTKGGEVTGVFQFKVNVDEIHNYKGVTVAGSHFVKEDDKFIMVKDSPLSVKIDKIPVVYSLDTTGRRIFIKDIEFADYNGDGVAKSFLTNAGVDLTGFDTEVLRQVENRLI